MKGAADYASGLASSTYFQTIPNYLQLVTMGGNAAAQTGTLGAQSTQMINSAGTNAAAAGAAGTIGAANAWSGGLNTAASGLSNAFMTNAMFKQLAAG